MNAVLFPTKGEDWNFTMIDDDGFVELGVGQAGVGRFRAGWAGSLHPENPVIEGVPVRFENGDNTFYYTDANGIVEIPIAPIYSPGDYFAWLLVGVDAWRKKSGIAARVKAPVVTPAKKPAVKPTTKAKKK